MAVGAALEIAGAQDTVSFEGPRARTRLFQVLTTSNLDRSNGVLNAAGLPQLGHVHPDDPGTFVEDLIPAELEQRSGGGAKWIVTCVYTNQGLTRQITSLTADPTEDPYSAWRTYVAIDEVADRAYGVRDREVGGGDGLIDDLQDTSVPITNSADQLFRDTVTRKRMQERIHLRRNENRNQTDPSTYGYTLNSAAITILGRTYQEEELLMMPPKVRQLDRGTFPYDEMLYEIHVDREHNHRVRRMDLGGVEKDLVNGGVKQIVDSVFGVMVEAPLRLGVAIQLPLQDAANRRAIVREFQVQKKLNWDPLGLPT